MQWLRVFTDGCARKGGFFPNDCQRIVQEDERTFWLRPRYRCIISSTGSESSMSTSSILFPLLPPRLPPPWLECMGWVSKNGSPSLSFSFVSASPLASASASTCHFSRHPLHHPNLNHQAQTSTQIIQARTFRPVPKESINPNPSDANPLLKSHRSPSLHLLTVCEKLYAQLFEGKKLSIHFDDRNPINILWSNTVINGRRSMCSKFEINILL